jgi:hypothetical protein
VRRQNLVLSQIGNADGVLELFWLLFTTMQAAARTHPDLVLENLLLRHQLAAATRPTRNRSRFRLRLWDKLLWILASRGSPTLAWGQLIAKGRDDPFVPPLLFI